MEVDQETLGKQEERKEALTILGNKDLVFGRNEEFEQTENIPSIANKTKDQPVVEE